MPPDQTGQGWAGAVNEFLARAVDTCHPLWVSVLPFCTRVVLSCWRTFDGTPPQLHKHLLIIGGPAKTHHLHLLGIPQTLLQPMPYLNYKRTLGHLVEKRTKWPEVRYVGGCHFRVRFPSSPTSFGLGLCEFTRLLRWNFVLHQQTYDGTSATTTTKKLDCKPTLFDSVEVIGSASLLIS